MVVGIINQILNFNKNQRDKINNDNEDDGNDDIATTTSSTPPTKTIVMTSAKKGYSQHIRSSRTTGGGSFAITCDKKCYENTKWIYLLVGSLGLCVFSMAVLGYTYVNRATDINGFRENLKNEFVISDIKELVKYILTDLKEENFLQER